MYLALNFVALHALIQAVNTRVKEKKNCCSMRTLLPAAKENGATRQYEDRLTVAEPTFSIRSTQICRRCCAQDHTLPKNMLSRADSTGRESFPLPSCRESGCTTRLGQRRAMGDKAIGDCRWRQALGQ